MGRLFGRKKQSARGKPQQQQPQQTEERAAGTGDHHPSVHRRNVHLFAQPVILVFHVIRFIAFQLWILLSLMCRASVNMLPARHKERTAAKSVENPPLISSPGVGIRMGGSGSVSSGGSSSSFVDLTSSPARVSVSQPPPEPAIAKQKQHHRKAFEYISKALKLDSEDRCELCR